jgi:hypothetical protein
MRSIQDTDTIGDTLYAEDKSDAGVGTERRRQFLNRHEFRFSTTLWNAFLIELLDSVVFSVVQTVMEFERFGWL